MLLPRCCLPVPYSAGHVDTSTRRHVTSRTFTSLHTTYIHTYIHHTYNVCMMYVCMLHTYIMLWIHTIIISRHSLSRLPLDILSRHSLKTLGSSLETLVLRHRRSIGTHTHTHTHARTHAHTHTHTHTHTLFSSLRRSNDWLTGNQIQTKQRQRQRWCGVCLTASRWTDRTLIHGSKVDFIKHVKSNPCGLHAAESVCVFFCGLSFLLSFVLKPLLWLSWLLLWLWLWLLWLLSVLQLSVEPFVIMFEFVASTALLCALMFWMLQFLRAGCSANLASHWVSTAHAAAQTYLAFLCCREALGYVEGLPEYTPQEMVWGKTPWSGFAGEVRIGVVPDVCQQYVHHKGFRIGVAAVSVNSMSFVGLRHACLLRTCDWGF